MTGEQPRLVFVPGLVSDETVWRPAADLLAPYPVAFADVTQPQSITEMAEHLLAAYAGRLIIAGHSMGGRVALEAARLAPERVAGLALFDTGFHPKKDGEDVKRRHFIDLANSGGMDALLAEWLPPMVHAPRRADKALMSALEAMVRRMTPAIHERQLRALLGRPDAWPGLADIGCPVLVAVGRQDGWSPLAQHEQMAAALPDAKLVVIEDAGHFAPIEQPDATAAALRQWITRISESAMSQSVPPIPTTPLLDRRHALSGYNINKMAMALMDPANRDAFRADEGAYLDRFSLTPAEKSAVLGRDWQEMVRLGGNLFFILKISAIDPTPITQIGADQAGMEHTAFLTQRLGKKING